MRYCTVCADDRDLFHDDVTSLTLFLSCPPISFPSSCYLTFPAYKLYPKLPANSALSFRFVSLCLACTGGGIVSSNHAFFFDVENILNGMALVEFAHSLSLPRYSEHLLYICDVICKTLYLGRWSLSLPMEFPSHCKIPTQSLLLWLSWSTNIIL